MSEIGQIRSLAKYNQSWGKQSIRDEIITLCDKALQERDELQRKLDIAVKLLKNLKPILDKLGYGIGDTLTEIEKVGKDE